MDISEFPAGAYLLKAVQDNYVQNIHFIKK